MWNRLVYLYTHATGKIFLNEAIKLWFEQFLPPNYGLSFIMDGDLPKKDYFKDDFSSKLSSRDGAVHTLIAGRMIGISNDDLSVLVRNNIHIHLYTENYHACKEKAMVRYMQIAPKHFHIHSHVSADTWTKEFSQYDAGWLHCFKSCDNSDFERLDVGIFFHDFYELSNKLKEQMKVKHLFFKEAIRIKKQQIYG